ncbi:MAG: DUF262 domain-containing protein [Oscillospiraceae bacterium]|nr:DUF262 domain-containing protein [Oscillospiraceae bacterium]
MANKLAGKKVHAQGELSFIDIQEAVNKKMFCLPAIQRGFVWAKEDIADFFDSLLKGFPIGNLLLWQLSSEDDRKATAFYPINTNENSLNIEGQRRISGFLTEKDRRYCVIDGQQRITALYRGLNCRYSVDGKKYLLYFDVMADNTKPAFRYFSKERIENGHFWIPVKNIWAELEKGKEMAYLSNYRRQFSEKDKYYRTNAQGEQIRRRTQEVERVDSICRDFDDNKSKIETNYKRLIYCFKSRQIPYSLVDLSKIETGEETVEKLFEVFVRLNNSGKPINPTDLLFAQIAKSGSVDELWELFDEAVSRINNDENGAGRKSKFSQEHLLRFIWLAYRTDNSSFKKYYTTGKLPVKLEEKMDNIVDAFIKAKKAFIEGKLSFSKNTPYGMFLPIAYYFYYGGKNSPDSTLEIERYYENVLLSNAFSQSTDTVMSKIVEALGKNRNNITLFGNKRIFNYQTLKSKLKELGASYFDIGSEELSAILNKTYDKNKEDIKRILFLLSRKYLQNTSNYYDLDHMHPKKYAENEIEFYKEVGGNTPDNKELFSYYQKHVNVFGNLQLLDEYGNRGEKNDNPLDKWLCECRKPNNLHEYAVSNFICGAETPDGQPSLDYFKLKNFKEFYEKREKTLRKALADFFDIKDQ